MSFTDWTEKETYVTANKWKFSVAPMMDWTDSPCRVLHRCLTKNALLYTEMVTADAILRGDRVIGRIEPVHDRKAGELHVLGTWWEDGVKPVSLQAPLRNLARFLGARLTVPGTVK